MCIVVFHWSPDSDSPLTLASNRDEFFVRPTLGMHWWDDAPILAGRDLKGDGTWLGVTRSGRFALLTNVRNPALRKAAAPSRGELVKQFLSGAATPESFLGSLAERLHAFEGFNVLCGDVGGGTRRALMFLNSTEGRVRALNAGIYALSNASLDTPWPKVLRIKSEFTQAMQLQEQSIRQQRIEQLLRDETRADTRELPHTGIPPDWEQALSSIFIRHANDDGALPVYGTRASTLLHVSENKILVSETQHTETQVNAQTSRYDFTIE
jgi:uncharacterized protein with NRDE domain